MDSFIVTYRANPLVILGVSGLFVAFMENYVTLLQNFLVKMGLQTESKLKCPKVARDVFTVSLQSLFRTICFLDYCFLFYNPDTTRQ